MEECKKTNQIFIGYFSGINHSVKNTSIITKILNEEKNEMVKTKRNRLIKKKQATTSATFVKIQIPQLKILSGI